MKNETKSKAVKLGAKIILKLTGLELLGEGGSFVYEAGKEYLPEATKNLIDATVDGTVDFFSDEAGDYAKNYLTKREKSVNFHLARGICKVWEDSLTASLPKNRAANSKYFLLPQDSFQDFNEQVEFFIAKFKQAQEKDNENLLIELFYDREKSEEGFYKTFFEAAQNENAAEEAYWETLKKTLRRWSIVEDKFRSEWKDDFPDDFSSEMKKFLFGNMRLGLKEIFHKNDEFKNAFQFSADLLIFDFVQKLPAQIQQQIENAQSENRFYYGQLQERFSGIENKITAIAEAIQLKFTQNLDTEVLGDILSVLKTQTSSQEKQISLQEKQLTFDERTAIATEQIAKKMAGNKSLESKPPESLPKRIAQESFPSHTNYFTGRDDVIGKIETTLRDHKKATLHGISGLGKTSVALEFAKRFEDSYQNIIFVRATRNDAVGNFARLAETIDETAKNLENDAARARRLTNWLEDRADWLLIIDNVDAPDEVLPLLPVTPRGHILSTGNSPTITVLGNEVEIEKMSAKNGALLLYRRSKTLEGLKDEEIETALLNETGAEQTAVRNLVEEFDGLPLALNLAGAYIHRFTKKFAEYENLYRTKAHQLLAEQDINSNYQNNSVALAFSLAFNEIGTPENDTAEARETADTAVLFLKTAAFLFPEAMPCEIFNRVLEIQNERGAELSGDEMFLDKVFGKIARFDLFEKDADAQTYDIHRLVQLVVFNKLEPDEKTALCSQILEILFVLFPEYDYFNKEACERFFRHTETALANADKLNLQNEISKSLYYRTARYQKLLGNYAQAEVFYRRNLETSKAVFGENDKETATSLNNLALVYNSQGRYDEAIELYQQALQIDEQTIGKEHPSYALRLNNLANVYYLQGRYDEAIELFKEALLIDKKTIGEEHPSYAIRLGNLSKVNIAKDDFRSAEKNNLQALKIFENSVGKLHPYYAICLNDLASVYGSQGRYDEAIKLFKQVLQIDEKTIGKEHPEYATHLNNLAGVYVNQSKYEIAEELIEQAKQICENSLGKEHPDTANTYFWIAYLRQKQGRYDEALPMYQEALRIFIKFLGENHPDTQMLRENLEICRTKMRD